jgi:two-component system nitrogen regulation sensor histidine kinase GlnL
MEEEISRLDRFITDFLSASLGDAEKETTDLNALLRRLEILTIMQAKAAGIEVLFRYGEVAPLQLSPFQVEQAILNVLNNALHVLSPGGKISVESRAETRGGRPFCVVEVTDNGPGIRDRSGEGYTAPLEDTARAQGKGFGLFITREVLQGHGGTLEVRSGEEMGTTVRLCFPQESREDAR